MSGDNTPSIRGPVPGPLAAALIAADEQYTSPSYTRVYPLAVKSALGMMIEDLDGNRFLDFTAGIAVCSTGHCHPRVVRAITDQAATLIHMSGTDFYYGPQRLLAERLAKLAPGTSRKRVFLTNSGAESVEAAIKLARYHTGRSQIIAFHGAFHGRTYGAMSLTASKVRQRAGFGPFVPGISHVGYGSCFRCPINLQYGSCEIACVSEIERVLFQRTIAAEEVAAIVVEPIQGEGGYIVPPPEFHGRLKALAEKHGILYIADEVQSGMGRTGKMFAIEHWGIEPDIICLAKGIASGMPLGAIVARDEIMDWPPGSHASTFGGNPIACAAALETIALLEESLVANAAVVGEFLLHRLRQLADRYPLVGDVRGRGLMVAIDLVWNSTKQPAKEQRDRIVEAAFRHGLLLLGCGESSIRFCPPLICSLADVDTAMQILENVFNAAE